MIVAFDPGRNIGVAFVADDGTLVSRQIAHGDDLATIAVPADAVVLVGNGTGSKELVGRLAALGHAAELVEEHATSLVARELYFRDHPPRGWQRLLPPAMRSPVVAIDDYAAYAIALRWLAQRRT